VNYRHSGTPGGGLKKMDCYASLNLIKCFKSLAETDDKIISAG
jgi:hypothetical protein